MCEKTDGIRCLMYLTELPIDGGGVVEAQFLIDRKNEYYHVQTDAIHIPLPKDFTGHHVGTLLDGELVRQKLPGGRTRLAYLIFDLLALDNENVMGKTFDKRLARIHENIRKPLSEFAARYPDDVAAQPFQIKVKEMQFSYAAEMMFRDKIPNLPHGNDGLIFTCCATGYISGTDKHILKWKPPHENTIDFRLLLGAFPMIDDGEGGQYEDWDAMPEFELQVNFGGKDGYKTFGRLTVEAAEWEALKALNEPIDGRIIECYRDPKASRMSNGNIGNAAEQDVWRPKLDAGVPRFRDDKKDANHISTVQSVEDSIRDAVTEQDLIAASGSIRSAYKARAAEAAAAAAAAAAAPPAVQKQKVEDDDAPTYED